MNIERIFGLWVLATALTISVVAAYYSIVGLTAIFAAAAIPVVIMGASLEVAKVTTAVWLHTYWHDTNMLMKTYLTSATLILMLITSMGIFGFLSKAHIEQHASSTELVAQIERTDAEISRQNASIEQANADIAALSVRNIENQGSLQSVIDSQNEQIESIQTTLAADIESVTNSAIGLFTAIETAQQLVDAATAEQQRLDDMLASNDVRALQAYVGAKVDGVRGPSTNRQIAERQTVLADRLNTATARLNAAQESAKPERDRIQLEVARLRAVAETEIASARKAIDDIRNRLVDVSTEDVTSKRELLEKRISDAQDEIDGLYQTKFEAETIIRQLEVEVGPVRYIAELIYGETNADLLEQSVRWVILILVFVFDPLAVVLVLAGVSVLHKTYPQRNIEESQVVPTESEGNLLEEDQLELEEEQVAIIEPEEDQIEETAEIDIATSSETQYNAALEDYDDTTVPEVTVSHVEETTKHTTNKKPVKRASSTFTTREKK